MKNYMAALAVFSFLAFSSCKKEQKNETPADKTEASAPVKLTVDSVQVSDSVKIGDSLSALFSSRMLVFPELKSKTLLDSIYLYHNGIKDFSKKGLEAYLNDQKDHYFSTVKKESKDILSDITFAQSWYTDSRMKLISNISDYMHLQYAQSSYMGGAHDQYAFAERVFDLKKNRRLLLKDITTIPTAKLEALLMKNVDKVPNGATDDKGDVKNSEMLLVEMIPVSQNFYFDQKNLYFHYSPYEITAFAAGDIIIPVSWEELNDTLVPGFKERMKIK